MKRGIAHVAADRPVVAGVGRGLLWLLVALTALGPAAMQIFIPALPAIRDAFDTSTAAAQLAFSVSTLAMAITTLFSGGLSDRFGRRPVVLGGLAGFLVGTLLCFLAPSIESLILGRVVQAAGGATGFVLTRAIVRDLYGRERSAEVIAYLTMAMVVAPMLAPVCGGLLTDLFGWRSIFVAGGAAGIVVLALALRRLPETAAPQPTAGGGTVASMLRLARIRAFQGYALQGAFSMSVFFAFLAGAPFVVVEVLHRPASSYGLYFVLVSLSFMLGNWTAARWTGRIGLDRMILLGSIGVLAATSSGLVYALTQGWSMVGLFGPMIVTAFAQGVAMPNSQAGVVSVDPRAAGAASGLAGFLQMTVAAGVAQLVGSLQNGTPWPTLVTMALCAAGMVASILWGSRRPGCAAD